MSAETWWIALRARESGAEQWVACEVTRDGDIVTARAHGYGYRTVEYAPPAVEGVGRLILQHDASLSLVRIATPAEYAAHMEGVRRVLAIDEVERLRAEVTRLADTLGAIGRRVCAESCDRDVILDAIDDSIVEAYDTALRRGAATMREVAAQACERRSDRMMSAVGQIGADACADDVRALPLPTDAAPSQPAQSHEAPATSEDPPTFADAAARARSAAAQRVASEAPVAAPDADAWAETWTDAGPRGLRVIRAALATAAPERWQAERLVEAAWLSRGRIDMGGDPLSMWHAIIDEAVLNERLDDLVAAARAKYPKCGL